MAGGEQRRESIAISLIGGCTIAEQQRSHLSVALFTGDQQRRESIAPSLIDGCTIAEQQRSHLSVALLTGDEQRRESMAISLIDGCTIAEQQRSHLSVPPLGGDQQRCGATFVCLEFTHISAALDECCCSDRSPVPARIDERSVTLTETSEV